MSMSSGVGFGTKANSSATGTGAAASSRDFTPFCRRAMGGASVIRETALFRRS